VTEIPHTDVWREIRVPAKVMKVWRDEQGWFCAFEDGRVYQGEWDTKDVSAMPKWMPFLPVVEGR
jgi:hypothetical protein